MRRKTELIRPDQSLISHRQSQLFLNFNERIFTYGQTSRSYYWLLTRGLSSISQKDLRDKCWKIGSYFSCNLSKREHIQINF